MFFPAQYHLQQPAVQGLQRSIHLNGAMLQFSSHWEAGSAAVHGDEGASPKSLDFTDNIVDFSTYILGNKYLLKMHISIHLKKFIFFLTHSKYSYMLCPPLQLIFLLLGICKKTVVSYFVHSAPMQVNCPQWNLVRSCRPATYFHLPVLLRTVCEQRTKWK